MKCHETPPRTVAALLAKGRGTPALIFAVALWLGRCYSPAFHMEASTSGYGSAPAARRGFWLRRRPSGGRAVGRNAAGSGEGGGMLARPLLHRILSDDALTRGLGDPEARVLVEWLVERAERFGRTAASEAAVTAEVGRLCRRARGIVRFVVLW